MRGLALEKKKGEGVVLETGKWGNAVGDRELDASMQWQLRCGFMQRGAVLVCFEILCSFCVETNPGGLPGIGDMVVVHASNKGLAFMFTEDGPLS